MQTDPDPTLDLVLERTIDVPPAFVWRAWTEADLLKRWFTPAPWTTADCAIDLAPGGIFRTRMRGPDGQEVDNEGCYLEVVPERRLVWTGALKAGWRPRVADPAIPFLMTAVIELEPVPPDGTRYRATVLHADRAGRDAHERMGFHAGWGAALDQLVALFKG